MDFKSFLLIAAFFFGLLALSAAAKLPRSEKNYMVSGLERLKKLHAKPVNIHSVEDASDLVELYAEYWKFFSMAATLDNVHFFDAKVPNPVAPGDFDFQNTYLRGLHRLKQVGPATLEHISDQESILTFALKPTELEFHSHAIFSYIGRPILGMRSVATVDNLNLHLKIGFNQNAEIPVKLLHLYIDPNPKFSVTVKTLKSQWGDDPIGNTATMGTKKN